MCGIAGIFAYDRSAPPVDEAELLRIREAMVRRGPDGAGRLARSTQENLAMSLMPELLRTAWGAFPSVWIYADECMNPILVSDHAVERAGVNAIPEALADIIAGHAGWRADSGIVQTNIVAHTGADGFSRLARQAEFGGDVASQKNHVLVDDFVGQGGTLANLRAHIVRGGGSVLGATVLTGKAHSAIPALTESTLEALRNKHGQELENWWRQRFGFGFDCLTESEARYLLDTPGADRVRNQIVAAVQA